VQRYEIITNDKKNFTEQLSIDTYKVAIVVMVVGIPILWLVNLFKK